MIKNVCLLGAFDFRKNASLADTERHSYRIPYFDFANWTLVLSLIKLWGHRVYSKLI